MVIDTSVIALDLSGAIAEMPTTFTWAGANYTGALTNLQKGKNLGEGGFITDFQGQIHCSQSSFGTLPSAGITVGIGTATYRVDKVTVSPDNAEVILDIITPNK